MLKDLEGSLKASSNYIESHRTVSGPTGTQEFHEVRSYSSGGQPPTSSMGVDDFNLERQVQHMMPSTALNGASGLQSANMVSSVQHQKQQKQQSSYTTYKVQTNQYGSSGERIEQQQERPGSRLKQNIDELDTLLYDLNNARKMGSDAGGDYTASSITPGNMSSDDYSFNDNTHLQDHVKKTVNSYNEYSYQTGGSTHQPSGKPPSPSPRRRPTTGPALSSPSAVRKLSPGPPTRRDQSSSHMASSSSYNYSSSQEQERERQHQLSSSVYPERPNNVDGAPNGVSYYTKYHSTHSHQSQGNGPVAFPTSSTPRVGAGKTQAPPKRVDELLSELSEFDSSIQTTGFVEPAIEPPRQQYREPSPEPYRYRDHSSPVRQVKQSSTPGPAVYYPPGDMFSSTKSKAVTETVHPSGTDAGPVVVHHSANGQDRAKGKSKDKDKYSDGDGKQGAAVIPICLPLCCAAPCVIM
jgi:hypothetical protein